MTIITTITTNSIPHMWVTSPVRTVDRVLCEKGETHPRAQGNGTVERFAEPDRKKREISERNHHRIRAVPGSFPEARSSRGRRARHAFENTGECEMPGVVVRPEARRTGGTRGHILGCA